jgi:hypothetical protein
LVRLKAQEGILKWFGKIQWQGDLAAMRESRFPGWGDKPKTGKRHPARPFDKAAK